MRTAALALAVLLLACNTLPVGYDELGRYADADSLNAAPETTASYGKYIATGSAETMLLGRDDEYESRLIIDFGLADSALDSISSMQLILHPADSTEMRFVCRPCSIPWNSAAVTWQMADSVTHWLNPGGDYWHVDLTTGTFEGESLVLDLDLDHLETLVRESHGIIVFPEDTGFASIHSRYSESTSPRIRITYLDDAEKVYTATGDAHLVDTSDVEIGYQALIVGSGYAFRTFYRFELDAIPPEATVARADLVFRPIMQYWREDTVDFGVYRLTEPYSSNAEYATSSYRLLSFPSEPEEDSVARLDLRSLVQFWTANPDSNFGLLVRAAPEWSEMFRMRIPVSGPDAARLELLWVMPPRGRFRQ